MNNRNTNYEYDLKLCYDLILNLFECKILKIFFLCSLKKFRKKVPQKCKVFFLSLKIDSRTSKKSCRMSTTTSNEKEMTASQLVSIKLSYVCWTQPEKDIKKIIQNWIRILDIKLGWINDFDKIVFKYVKFFLIFRMLKMKAKYFELQKVLKAHKYEVTRVKFSPDSCKIVSASWDKTVRIWDAASGTQIQKFVGHMQWVNAAEFSPDGNTVISCSNDTTIRLWDIKSKAELVCLKAHIYSIADVTFSPDGKTIVSGVSDNTIQIWDIHSEKQIQTLIGHSNSISSVQFSPDGQMIMSASCDDTIVLWNAKSGEKLKVLKGHTNTVKCACFSPDSRFIASCSHDNTIRIWDAESGEELKILKGHLGYVNAVQYFPDGRSIVSCSSDKTIRLWDVKTGNEIQQLDAPDKPSYVDVSHDGNTIVSSTWQNIHIWR
ncbi:Pfs, NACHT and WD domain protein [Reticulomyxa filosa]|uniref:Pfs, NACHT and WD domain protein n=1 Tax=Reticulomyxa filosa TaxID=46433 RepID=X6NV75_RETFI|nr:Pfs, NACHT and WD domain protein [Reticulomyxa filosa]|eukprot:ETO29709.1 Pfs, NACHT and WD domain protein [Reticulomyxa filosa]